MGKLKNILLIDDSYSIQMSLKKYLESMNLNLNIHMASNGEDGLNYCRMNIIDLIILDLAMPKMNGIQFLVKRNAIERLKNIPVIVLSAVDKKDIVQKAIELGAKTFILKPIEIRMLYNAINQLFDLADNDFVAEDTSCLHKKNILVIDDSYSMRTIMKNYLQELNEDFRFTILQATDGIEGLECCHRHVIDIIFLDLNMPNMNGIEFLEKKREINALKDIPVVVVSSVDSKDKIRQAMELGAKEYITKPIALTLLSKAIYEILETKFIVFDSVVNGKTEIFIHQEIIIAEIHESLTTEFVHSINYKIQKITKTIDKYVRGFLIVFVSIPENHITINKLHTLLTFYKELDGMRQENIKIVTNSRKIKKLVMENTETKNIIVLPTMIEALQAFNKKIVKDKCRYIETNKIIEDKAITTTLYDEYGNIIKKRNEKFRKEEIGELHARNIVRLYYVINEKERIFNSPFYDLSDFSIPNEEGFLIK